MKPIVEFVLACLLIFVAGCSTIAGFFYANLWAAIFAASSIVALVIVFTYGTRSKQ